MIYGLCFVIQAVWAFIVNTLTSIMVTLVKAKARRQDHQDQIVPFSSKANNQMMKIQECTSQDYIIEFDNNSV